MTPHVADLLPGYVNRTLDIAAMASVRDHLRFCPDCRVSHAAWQALAAATREAADEEQWLSREPNTSMRAILGGIASPLREREMDATMIMPAPAGAGRTVRKTGRRFGSSRVGRGLELVAALAIAAVVVAGFFAYRGVSPFEGGPTMPGAAQNATPDAQAAGCTVTPRTPEDLARVLVEPGPAESAFLEFTSLPKLPEGAPLEEATRAAIEPTWNEYWHCDNNGERLAAYALLTDHGVRRVFFRTTLDENAAFYQSANPEPAGTPNPEPKPDDVSEKPRMLPAPFRLTDGVVLADGRVLMLFKVAWAPEEAESIGTAIFVREGDRWLIDEYIFYHG